MNRIETKIIIMITNRLSAAKDSEAKTEMIEELSENLYQRYLELAAEGLPEEEALLKAFENLGDVDELLAYLKEEEAEENIREEKTFHDRKSSFEEKAYSFLKDDLESGIEEIVNAAFSTAKVAVDCARDVAKDVSDQLKEKYPEGVFNCFSGQRGQKVEGTAIFPENVHSLEIRLTNGNIRIRSAEQEDSLIEIVGDTEEIEAMLKEDGILSITQGNTASAAYFFIRGMRRSDIEVRLPKKLWNSITVSTVNGDIRIEDALACSALNASTASGDLNVKRVSGGNMTLHSISGDIEGGELSGNLYGETKSGSIRISGTYGQCQLFCASGDVHFEGESQELNCSSTSGTVELELEKIPEKTKGNSISGDCKIRASKEEGFHISYRTVSGKFMTNLPLAGTLKEKSGDAVYKEGGRGEVQLSTVSGDISLCAAE